MHMIDQLNKPIIFAHRGASRYAPENTMAAFDLAFSMGAPAIELDTMLTKDGVPVVMHDRTVNRTTNGSGRVDQLTFGEIARLDAGSYFSKDFTGERVPRLADVLAKYKGKMLVNIELKNYHAPFDQLPECIAGIVRKLDNLEEIIFSSFWPNNLLRIRKLLQGAKTALLVENGFIGRILTSRVFSRLSPDFIHPFKSYINIAYLEYEHTHNRQVNVWTVNDFAQAKNFMQWGVDGLITDDPQGVMKLLSSIG